MKIKAPKVNIKHGYSFQWHNIHGTLKGEDRGRTWVTSINASIKMSLIHK